MRMAVAAATRKRGWSGTRAGTYTGNCGGDPGDGREIHIRINQSEVSSVAEAFE